MNMEYEKIKDGVYVCRSETHSFGTDAFLLTGFSRCKSRDRVCDLGTGCGIIPMLMQRGRAPQMIYAVDIQPDAIRQVKLGLQKSDTGLRIEPICADLRNLWEGAPVGQLDLVTCNPPYNAADTGILSSDPQKLVARHEAACTLDDICCAAAKLLNYHGRLCMCCRPERLTDMMCAMRNAGLEPKRLRLVCKSADSAPWLFLMEGMKGAKPFLQIEPSLIVRSGDGLTSEAAALCLFGDHSL